jgi:hypothetical protein
MISTDCEPSVKISIIMPTVLVKRAIKMVSTKTISVVVIRIGAVMMKKNGRIYIIKIATWHVCREIKRGNKRMQEVGHWIYLQASCVLLKVEDTCT